MKNSFVMALGALLLCVSNLECMMLRGGRVLQQAASRVAAAGVATPAAEVGAAYTWPPRISEIRLVESTGNFDPPGVKCVHREGPGTLNFCQRQYVQMCQCGNRADDSAHALLARARDLVPNPQMPALASGSPEFKLRVCLGNAKLLAIFDSGICPLEMLMWAVSERMGSAVTYRNVAWTVLFVCADRAVKQKKAIVAEEFGFESVEAAGKNFAARDSGAAFFNAHMGEFFSAWEDVALMEQVLKIFRPMVPKPECDDGEGCQ